MSNIPKFSEFAKGRKYLTGNKTNLKQILNIPVIVTDYKIDSSKFKQEDYVAIQFKKVGEDIEQVVFTGAVVLKDQLEEYKQYIPFETKIQKLGKFYSFT